MFVASYPGRLALLRSVDTLLRVIVAFFLQSSRLELGNVFNKRR